MIMGTLISNTKTLTKQRQVRSWIKHMFDKSAIKRESIKTTPKERYRILNAKKIDMRQISYN